LLPWFLWLFVARVALNSTAGLARRGRRPIALIVAEAVWLAVFVRAAVLMLR